MIVSLIQKAMFETTKKTPVVFFFCLVLTRIMDQRHKVISSRGLAFRGSDQQLGSVHNGNYLGLWELLALNDAFLAKHLATYDNKGKGNTSYLSANICEEFIKLLSEKLETVIGKIKNIKHIANLAARPAACLKTVFLVFNLLYSVVELKEEKNIQSSPIRLRMCDTRTCFVWFSAM